MELSVPLRLARQEHIPSGYVGTDRGVIARLLDDGQRRQRDLRARVFQVLTCLLSITLLTSLLSLQAYPLSLSRSDPPALAQAGFCDVCITRADA